MHRDTDTYEYGMGDASCSPPPSRLIYSVLRSVCSWSQGNLSRDEMEPKDRQVGSVKPLLLAPVIVVSLPQTIGRLSPPDYWASPPLSPGIYCYYYYYYY